MVEVLSYFLRFSFPEEVVWGGEDIESRFRSERDRFWACLRCAVRYKVDDGGREDAEYEMVFSLPPVSPSRKCLMWLWQGKIWWLS